MNNMIQSQNTNDLEYQKNCTHNVNGKESQENRNDSMEDNTRIHMYIDYKKKKVRVHLGFSEETNDKNIKIFYDSLKKIYIEKIDFKALKI